MTSREEFLRSMGISNDDLREPPLPPPSLGTPTGNKREARENFMREMGISDSGPPPPPPRTGGGSGMSEERLAFMKKMGITAEDMGSPGRVASSSDEASSSLPSRHASCSSSWSRPSSSRSCEAPDGLDGMSVDELKEAGNKCFQDGAHRRAIFYYTQAIQLDPTNHVLYSNRSAAYLQGRMGCDTRKMALRDAEKCVELKPQWFKSHSRRGDALFKLERFAEAAEAYEHSLRLSPDNPCTIKSLAEAKAALTNANTVGSNKWAGEFNASAEAGMSSQLEGLLNRFNSECSRAGMKTGKDYLNKELEMYRERRRSGSDTASFSSSCADVPTPVDSHHIQEEVRNEGSMFSSAAAASYKESIMENFRKKKATTSSSSSAGNWSTRRLSEADLARPLNKNRASERML